MKLKLTLDKEAASKLGEEKLRQALAAAFPELEGRLSFEESSFDKGGGASTAALPFYLMLAHELKAPLNAAQGYLRMMQARANGPELSAYDEMIARSTLRLDAMRELVENIVALAKAEAGLGTRRLEELDAKRELEEAFEPLREAAEAKGAKASFSVPEGLTLRSAPGDLRTLLANLISNAIKYNRKNGSIKVSLSKKDGIFTARVEDEGFGLSPEEIERLDGDFVRIKSPETKNEAGSGLGLPLVRRIAQLYGGELSIESVKGSGSSFSASLREPPAV